MVDSVKPLYDRSRVDRTWSDVADFRDEKGTCSYVSLQLNTWQEEADKWRSKVCV